MWCVQLISLSHTHTEGKDKLLEWPDHSCLLLYVARASTKTFVSQVRKTAKKIFVSRGITVYMYLCITLIIFYDLIWWVLVVLSLNPITYLIWTCSTLREFTYHDRWYVRNSFCMALALNVFRGQHCYLLSTFPLTEESFSVLESHHQRHLMQNCVLVNLSLSMPWKHVRHIEV
jgi:hypothetical protein